MGTDPLLEVADELYSLAPTRFTAARDSRARELKQAEPTLAAQVKALRKPSVAAWVVNLLVRQETAQVEEMLAVGAALREAQAALDGEELRALTRQRRQLTAAVTARARALAAGAGHRVTEPVAAQVEATLTAAMLDPGAAGAVRSGLLVGALAATGVDEVDLTGALAAPTALGFRAAARTEPARGTAEAALRLLPAPEPDHGARLAAEEAVADAERDLSRAQGEHEAARAHVEERRAESLQLQGELDELRRRVAELETRAEANDDELLEEEDALAAAAAAAAAAQRRVEAARQALAQLALG